MLDYVHLFTKPDIPSDVAEDVERAARVIVDQGIPVS
jgi:hypothetical protein